MQEREFIEALNLLRETETGLDFTVQVMRKIKRHKRIGILIKSILLAPFMFFLSLESIRIIAGTPIPKVIFSAISIPEFLFMSPPLFVFLYAAATGIYTSILISTYLEGGDVNGALLLPSRQGSSSSVLEM